MGKSTVVDARAFYGAHSALVRHPAPHLAGGGTNGKFFRSKAMRLRFPSPPSPARGLPHHFRFLKSPDWRQTGIHDSNNSCGEGSNFCRPGSSSIAMSILYDRADHYLYVSVGSPARFAQRLFFGVDSSSSVAWRFSAGSAVGLRARRLQPAWRR